MAGSSECFGDTGGLPADETTAFRPRSPYAVAKATAHWQIANYREAYGLYACTGILFNHESPLRPERFVTRKIIAAALTTRYRDLSIVVGFGVQLLMYATPVIYPLSLLPEPYRTWMLLNPMAPIMELFRHAYLGAGEVSLGLLLYATVLIGLILFVGILLFNRVERTFMDTV